MSNVAKDRLTADAKFALECEWSTRSTVTERKSNRCHVVSRGGAAVVHPLRTRWMCSAGGPRDAIGHWRSLRSPVSI